MSWILYVYIVASINGLEVNIPTVVQGPIAFTSAELCVMHGRRYVTATTKVVCDSKQAQIEVRT